MMSEIINEYSKRPELSTTAAIFVDSYEGGPIPQEIREELIQYLKDIGPHVEAAKHRLR